MGFTGYGVYTLIGDTPVGPFRAAAAAYRLCGNSTRWVALWARFCRTDGTASGTFMVYNAGGNQVLGYSRMTALNSRLYFRADDGAHGYELWSSDGTTSGTSMIRDINPSGSSEPSFLVTWNGRLYFTADDGSNGVELWTTDGTLPGTIMVHDINPGSGSSAPAWITPTADALYFTAVAPNPDNPSGPASRQLWKSDGTAAGTVLIKTINPTGDCEPFTNTQASFYWNLRFPTIGGKMYFRASNGIDGVELAAQPPDRRRVEDRLGERQHLVDRRGLKDVPLTVGQGITDRPLQRWFSHSSSKLPQILRPPPHHFNRCLQHPLTFPPISPPRFPPCVPPSLPPRQK